MAVVALVFEYTTNFQVAFHFQVIQLEKHFDWSSRPNFIKLLSRKFYKQVSGVPVADGNNCMIFWLVTYFS